MYVCRLVPAGARHGGAGAAAVAVALMTETLVLIGPLTVGAVCTLAGAATMAVVAAGAGITTGVLLVVTPSTMQCFTACGCGSCCVQRVCCAVCTSCCLQTLLHRSMQLQQAQHTWSMLQWHADSNRLCAIVLGSCGACFLICLQQHYDLWAACLYNTIGCGCSTRPLGVVIALVVSCPRACIHARAALWFAYCTSNAVVHRPTSTHGVSSSCYVWQQPCSHSTLRCTRVQLCKH